MSYDAFESREILQFLAEQRALDKLPLKERKENAAEFLDAMRTQPEIVAERVGWIFNGSYGQGAYIKSREVANSPRMNRAAALTMMVAGVEWSVPGRMVAAACHKLSPAEKKRLDTYLQKEIQDFLKEQKEEGGRDRSRTRRRPAKKTSPTRRRASVRRRRS